MPTIHQQVFFLDKSAEGFETFKFCLEKTNVTKKFFSNPSKGNPDLFRLSIQGTQLRVEMEACRYAGDPYHTYKLFYQDHCLAVSHIEPISSRCDIRTKIFFDKLLFLPESLLNPSNENLILDKNFELRAAM